MKDKESGKRGTSTVRTVVLTASLTLILAGGVGYFAGVVGSRDHQGEGLLQIAGEVVEEILYTCGMHPWIVEKAPGNCPICAMKLTPKRDTAGAGSAGGDGERKIVYWRAPMNPTEVYDKPGTSAMGMELVPVYEDEIIGGVVVRIDPVTRQNMGIRTKKVEKDDLVHTIRTYGHVTYDETRTVQVSLKTAGWIEKLHVDFTGIPVKKGQPLFEIYSPDLLAAQEEYLVAYRNAQRMSDKGRRNLLESAARRLAWFDISEEEITAIGKTGKPRKTLTINSPASGIVIAKNVEEGSYVKSGTLMFKISDLSRVWVETHIYEYELPWVEVGQEAEMTFPYLPGKTFTGKVTFIYPYLQAKTRDVVVRLEFENPGLSLKPDMYSDVRIRSRERGKGIVVPSEAVIRSGERNVVFVTREAGVFIPREVSLGLKLDGDRFQVLAGLAEGETVVTSGQFLLDSESKLQEAVQKMIRPEEPASPTDAATEDDFLKDMEMEEGGEKDDFFDDMEEKS